MTDDPWKRSCRKKGSCGGWRGRWIRKVVRNEVTSSRRSESARRLSRMSVSRNPADPRSSTGSWHSPEGDRRAVGDHRLDGAHPQPTWPGHDPRKHGSGPRWGSSQVVSDPGAVRGCPAGVDSIQEPVRSAEVPGRKRSRGGRKKWRRVRDLNPRWVAPKRFSKPSHSAALPTLR